MLSNRLARFLSLLFIYICSANNINEEYYQYLTDFGKDLSRFNDEERLFNFNKTLSIIKYHNLQNSTFELNLNQFADLIPDEMASIFIEDISNDVDNDTLQFNEMYLKIPHDLNWATSNNPTGIPTVSPVRDQGSCGACWAFVAVGATEASVRIRNMITVGSSKDIILSVQELIDCDNEKNRGCNGGNPVIAYDFIIKYGLSSYITLPYAEKVTNTF